MSYLRGFEIDRAAVNVETGEFRAVVFTDGEASDGHILSIDGAVTPERMPLFVNHQADPRTQLGSLYFERKTEHQIHYRGEIMLDGVGEQAEVRRDLLAKMAAGHVSRMSGRWDAEDADATRRMELPEDHHAYVSEKQAKKSWRLRYGYFFRKWRAQEGSIVGLGADPQATMRFAEDEAASPAVRAFWRGVAEAEQSEADGAAQEHPITVRDMASFVSEVADLIRSTVKDEVASAIAAREPVPTQAETPVEITAETSDGPDVDALREQIASLEAKVSALEGRETEGAPSPPPSLRDAFDALRQQLAEDRRASIEAMRAEFTRRRGRIDEMDALRREQIEKANADMRRVLGIPDEEPEGGESDVTPDMVLALVAALRKNRKALV